MSRNVVTSDYVRQQKPNLFVMGSLDLEGKETTINAADAKPSAPSALVADDYMTRLIKYVPPEIIAAYSAIVGIINAYGSGNSSDAIMEVYASLGAFIFLLICTPMYLKKVAKITQQRLIVVNTIAFAIWAFALPAIPFEGIPYHNLFAPIVTVLYTIAVPLIEIPTPPVARHDPLVIPEAAVSDSSGIPKRAGF